MIVWGMVAMLAAPQGVAAQTVPDPSNDMLARVVVLTNAERQKVGLPPLRASAQLTQAAQSYAQVLASGSCFAHDCPPDPDMAARVERAGYVGWSWIAENIAAGQRTPEEVVASWMKSPGHRANILGSRTTEIGVGFADGGGSFGRYWTQEFGSRRGGSQELLFQPVVQAAADVVEAAGSDEVPALDEGDAEAE